jgi:hypothetical protein
MAFGVTCVLILILFVAGMHFANKLRRERELREHGTPLCHRCGAPWVQGNQGSWMCGCTSSPRVEPAEGRAPVENSLGDRHGKYQDF